MPDINESVKVNINYPVGFEGGSAEFLTHGGTRAHIVNIANGTNVDPYGKSATTVYDVRIEERPVEGIIKHGFSTVYGRSVDLEVGEEALEADFRIFGDDAKDIAIRALRRQSGRLGTEVERLDDELVLGRRFVRKTRRVLLASIVALPVSYVLAEKVNDLFELGYFPAGVVSVLSFMNLLGELSGLRPDKRSRDAKVVEKAYLEESVAELQAIEVKIEEPDTVSEQSEA